MRLSEYAKLNGKKYYEVYREFKAGKIEGAIQMGSAIWIPDVDVKKTPKPTITDNEVSVASTEGYVDSKYQVIGTDVRRNAVTLNTQPANRFAQIAGVSIPFRQTNSQDGSCSYISPKEAINLCVKAYYGFPVVRNIIELMVEFCASEIYFVGGNKKAREFFTALYKKIRLKEFFKMCVRDYFRAGNCWIIRYDVQVNPKDINLINKTYGSSLAANFVLPARYEVLNPEDIQLLSSASYTNGTYVKELTKYQIESLRNGKTPEDKAILNGLAPEIQKQINDKRNTVVYLPLDATKVSFIAFAKQSYDPFGVSIIYPVLDDIEYKAEMKKIDAAIARTMQQAILLVTCGAEPEKGGINKKNIDALTDIFKNESVGRVLVADYTTEAEFVVPTIADLLDPKKYEVINQDIKDGLNNILLGGGSSEKFANKSIALDIFTERLRSTRETFINEFLTPEIVRISDEMGFKNYVTPKFTEINFKDENEQARIFTRLYEIGVLTPEETINAIETGILPTQEESLENQTQFKQSKEKGLYEPVQGGPATQKDLAEINNDAKLSQQQQKLASPNGRPAGTKGIKQKKKPAKRIGASEDNSEELTYSFNSLKEIAGSASALDTVVESLLKKKFKVKKLNGEQSDVVSAVSQLIISNEAPEVWEEKAQAYVDSPIDTNKEQVDKILSIAQEHGICMASAAILYHARN